MAGVVARGAGVDGEGEPVVRCYVQLSVQQSGRDKKESSHFRLASFFACYNELSKGRLASSYLVACVPCRYPQP